MMEIGPGIETRKQFVKDVRVVIDGGTLELSGPADPINGSTIEFTKVGGELVLTNHTPAEFRRKHGRKMRTREGERAIEGTDFEVVERPEGGCIVRPLRKVGRGGFEPAPPSVIARLDPVSYTHLTLPTICSV